MHIEGIEVEPNNVPEHVAIIMDGNRRWAEKRSLTALDGHRQGLEQVNDIMEACDQIGIRILTLYAFSIENWKRSSKEVNGLMQLFKYFYKRDFKKLQKKNIKIIHSGLKDNFSRDIQKIIDTMTSETKHNTKAILNLAINYSGRSEIIHGIKKLITQQVNSNVNLDDLTEEDFNQCLFHPELPHPDLLIRTSGEQRISNFLLWQLAYTELYFTNVLWPEFKKKDFVLAVSEYQKRERRYGGRN